MPIIAICDPIGSPRHNAIGHDLLRLEMSWVAPAAVRPPSLLVLTAGAERMDESGKARRIPHALDEFERPHSRLVARKKYVQYETVVPA